MQTSAPFWSGDVFLSVGWEFGLRRCCLFFVGLARRGVNYPPSYRSAEPVGCSAAGSHGWRRRSYSVCRGVCHRGSSLGGGREDESSLSSQPSSAAIQNRYKHFSLMWSLRGGKSSELSDPQSVARISKEAQMQTRTSGVRPVCSHKWAFVRLCCGFCLIELRIDRHKPEQVSLPSSRLPGRRVPLHAISDWLPERKKRKEGRP